MFSINLRKEIADGLRIYFNFTLREYLLYNPEREQAAYFTSPEFMKTFKYVAPERQSLDMLRSDQSSAATASSSQQDVQHSSDSQTNTTGDLQPPNEDKAKRRLRSYKNEESNEFILDINLPSAVAAKGDNSKSRCVLDARALSCFAYTILSLSISNFQCGQ